MIPVETRGLLDAVSHGADVLEEGLVDRLNKRRRNRLMILMVELAVGLSSEGRDGQNMRLGPCLCSVRRNDGPTRSDLYLTIKRSDGLGQRVKGASWKGKLDGCLS